VLALHSGKAHRLACALLLSLFPSVAQLFCLKATDLHGVFMSQPLTWLHLTSPGDKSNRALYRKPGSKTEELTMVGQIAHMYKLREFMESLAASSSRQVQKPFNPTASSKYTDLPPSTGLPPSAGLPPGASLPPSANLPPKAGRVGKQQKFYPEDFDDVASSKAASRLGVSLPPLAGC
jgi:hypothetical protein